MTDEENPQSKNTIWWIISIATSVVCCSILFVLFASYLVDVKADIQDNTMRIHAMEERQDRILTNIEILSKRGVAPGVPQPGAAILAPAPTSEAAPATNLAPGETVSTPPVAPAQDSSGLSSPGAGASVTVPTVTVPTATPPAMAVPTLSVPTLPTAPAKP
jgi:hypothetical protein